MLRDNESFSMLNNANIKLVSTYDAGINDAHDAKYRRYHVNAEIRDLREGDGGHVDDNGHIHKERNSEEHRGEDSDRPGKSNFQVLEGTG